MRTLFITLVLISSMFAQSADSELKKLQDKFASIENFTAEFEQNANSFGDNKKAKGKFFYSKGNKFRIEFGDQIICSDGKTVWNFNSSEKRVVINRLDDQPGIFSIDKYITEFSKFCDVEKISNGIRLKNCKDDNSFYNSIDLSYSSNYMLASVDIKDNMNNRYAFKLVNLIENKLKDNSVFNLKIPEGVRVIDLR